MSVTTPFSRVPVNEPAAFSDGASHAALDAQALDDIASGLACIERRVAASTDDDPTAPRSIRLIATANYDVWLITWPPSSEMGHHDHAESTSVLRMVSGSLTESVDLGYRLLYPGASVVTPPGTPHRLWNAGSGEATSLHVYSPPLTTVTYRPLSIRSLHPAGTARPAQSRPVRARRAEASEPSP